MTPTGFEAVEDTPPAIRVRYRHGGTAHGPSHDLAEVVVSDGPDVLAIALFERRRRGIVPSGGTLVSPLMGLTDFVEIPLARPVGRRKVIDGATGRTLERFELEETDERRRYGRRGCPVWEF